MQRRLVVLIRRIATHLFDLQREFTRPPPFIYPQQWGTGLFVPTPELSEIRLIGLLHGGNKIFRGGRTAVVPIKIQIGTGTKSLHAEHGLQHAHHLGTFLVDGRGIEI